MARLLLSLANLYAFSVETYVLYATISVATAITKLAIAIISVIVSVFIFS